jgi:hypothetical protein
MDNNFDSEPPKMDPCIHTNSIIGLVYTISVYKQGMIPDIINVLASLVHECGIIGETYKKTLAQNPNFIFRSVAAATHPNYENLKTQLGLSPACQYLGTVINKIIYSTNKWPSDVFKKSIIPFIFDTDENLIIRKTLQSIIQKNPVDLSNIDKEIQCIVYGLLALTKFLTDSSTALDLSNSLESARALEGSPGDITEHRFIASALIGATAGFKAIYKHIPFFKDRDVIDQALKLYLTYLSGERRRVKMGQVILEKGPAIRWLHPPNQPSPGGFWANNPMAHLKCVSYIEYQGKRYLEFNMDTKYDKKILFTIDEQLRGGAAPPPL